MSTVGVDPATAGTHVTNPKIKTDTYNNGSSSDQIINTAPASVPLSANGQLNGKEGVDYGVQQSPIYVNQHPINIHQQAEINGQNHIAQQAFMYQQPYWALQQNQPHIAQFTHNIQQQQRLILTNQPSGPAGVVTVVHDSTQGPVATIDQTYQMSAYSYHQMPPAANVLPPGVYNQQLLPQQAASHLVNQQMMHHPHHVASASIRPQQPPQQQQQPQQQQIYLQNPAAAAAYMQAMQQVANQQQPIPYPGMAPQNPQAVGVLQPPLHQQLQPQPPAASYTPNSGGKASKAFVPLYCGTCRAYGCQCFYGGAPSNSTINTNTTLNVNNVQPAAGVVNPPVGVVSSPNGNLNSVSTPSTPLLSSTAPNSNSSAGQQHIYLPNESYQQLNTSNVNMQTPPLAQPQMSGMTHSVSMQGVPLHYHHQQQQQQHAYNLMIMNNTGANNNNIQVINSPPYSTTTIAQPQQQQLVPNSSSGPGSDRQQITSNEETASNNKNETSPVGNNTIRQNVDQSTALSSSSASVISSTQTQRAQSNESPNTKNGESNEDGSLSESFGKKLQLSSNDNSKINATANVNEQTASQQSLLSGPGQQQMPQHYPSFNNNPQMNQIQSILYQQQQLNKYLLFHQQQQQQQQQQHNNSKYNNSKIQQQQQQTALLPNNPNAVQSQAGVSSANNSNNSANKQQLVHQNSAPNNTNYYPSPPQQHLNQVFIYYLRFQIQTEHVVYIHFKN
jgi:hypothetical protein